MKRWCHWCRKSVYPTQKVAERYRDRRLRDDPKLRLRVYDCTFRNGWHISSKRQKAIYQPG